MSRVHVIIADPNATLRQQSMDVVRRSGLDANLYESANVDHVIERFDPNQLQIILLAFRENDGASLEHVAKLHADLPHVAKILVTNEDSETLAARALRCGATDYMTLQHMLQDPEHTKRLIVNALERQELEWKLEQQREELLNFSRILSHDLRAPARQIRNFIDLMDNTFKNDGGVERIAQYFNQVKTIASHMDHLIDTLSTYTKIDHSVTFEPVDLKEVAEEALLILQDQLDICDASVNVYALPTVRGHKALLVQLFQNLIGNAITYNRSEPPKITIDSHPDSNDLGMQVIEFKDNGLGLSKEDAAKVFEPFKRFHGEEIAKGTGLGLSICRKIVTRHKGSIWCESEPDEGTTFSFTLPISF
ncbi:MAG: ATP-binding protein [Rickettsiales bacterium]|nr:ATP-binding protein [Rickettsiales bacterium]